MKEKKISIKTVLKADADRDWGPRIVIALKEIGQPVSPRALVDLLMLHFPLIEAVPDKRVYLSSQIFLACKRNWIRMHFSKDEMPFYCLPEWYDADGKLREGFTPNP